jgi:hypothetical protein
MPIVINQSIEWNRKKLFIMKLGNDRRESLLQGFPFTIELLLYSLILQTSQDTSLTP